MAIFDKQELFSDRQAITATAASTNVKDFMASGRWVHGSADFVDEKGNSSIPLGIQVVETFNLLTSLDIAVQVDDNSGFSSAKTVATVNILLADLVAGKKFPIHTIPWGADEQYMRIYYTVNGTAPTAGKITAGLACLENSAGNR